MREEKKQEKRNEIIGVCLDCFVEKGLTAVTTKDLCTAVNLQNRRISEGFTFSLYSRDTLTLTRKRMVGDILSARTRRRSIMPLMSLRSLKTMSKAPSSMRLMAASAQASTISSFDAK